MRSNADPPLVPFCRLIPNEEIQTIVIQVDNFKESFDRCSYMSTAASFFMSMLDPNSYQYHKITKVY